MGPKLMREPTCAARMQGTLWLRAMRLWIGAEKTALGGGRAEARVWSEEGKEVEKPA